MNLQNLQMKITISIEIVFSQGVQSGEGYTIILLHNSFICHLYCLTLVLLEAAVWEVLDNHFAMIYRNS